MVGVAVKVTLVPAQILVAVEAAILSDGVTKGATAMVIPLEVAVEVEAQFALLDSTQVITSPLVNDALVYVAELVPTLLPFSFHW